MGGVSHSEIPPLRALEGRHHLNREALELLEDHRLRRADGLPDVDDLEPRVLVLDLHELLGDQLRRTDQPRARLDGVAQGRQVRVTGARRVGGRVDLLRGQTGHEPERGEHLDVLLEERRRLLDPLLDAVGDVKREADAEVAAQLRLPPGARASRKAWITLSLAPPAAAPPPMMPLMPCLAMKSSARVLALTTGCQHSTGKVFGRGTSVISESS